MSTGAANAMNRADKLFDEIRALPKAERLRLAERVIRSVANETTESSAQGAAVVGAFSDEPELLDEITEDAMQTRERDPLRVRRE